MHKLWLVAKHEYINRVRQRTFLLGTLWVPFLLVLSMGVGFITSLDQRDTLPLGLSLIHI